MPKAQKDTEKICAFCAHFTFKPRREAGMAYCLKKQRWIPNQVARYVPESLKESWVPAGKRTCKHWESP